MKKGFTLIEVLAVLVILGIITALTYPVITKMIDESKEKAYTVQIDSIKDSARKWAIDNASKLATNRYIAVDISELVRLGYITKDENIIDPRNSEHTLNGCVRINYSDLYSQYQYEYVEPCPKNPIIVIDNETVNLSISTGNFVDSGVHAYTIYGEDISNLITSTIESDGTAINSIPLNIAGSYVITYSVTYSGLSSTRTKAINVN